MWRAFISSITRRRRRDLSVGGVSDVPAHAWRLQYSLRTLLVSVSAFAIVTAFWGNRCLIASRREFAVQRIKQLGGGVNYRNRPHSAISAIGRWVAGRGGTNDDVTAVTLAGCDFGPSDVQNLRLFGEMTDLYLSESEVSDRQISSISNLKQLHLLDLSATQVTNAGLRVLSNFEQLQDLRLDDTRVGDGGMEHLSKCPSLEQVSLNGCGITDRGVSLLAKNSRIRRLSLGRTKVSSVGIASLSELPSLDLLYLGFTTIDDGAAPALGVCRHIRYLSLRGTRITDRITQDLCEMKSLVWVDLSRTMVTAEGVARVQAALPSTVILVDPRPVQERHRRETAVDQRPD